MESSRKTSKTATNTPPDIVIDSTIKTPKAQETIPDPVDNTSLNTLKVPELSEQLEKKVNDDLFDSYLSSNIPKWIESAKKLNWGGVENGLNYLVHHFRTTKKSMVAKELPQSQQKVLQERFEKLKTWLNIGDKEKNRNLLMLALKDNKINIIRALLEMGVDVNQSDQDNMTPLHYAATFCNEDVLKELINRGANPKTKGGIHERLPLHIACCRTLGAQSLVTYLLKVSGDNSRITADGDDCIPLYLATEVGNNIVCKALLNIQSKAQCSYQKKDTGDTVLHLACRKKEVALAKLFLDSGAPIDLQNVEGHTPLHIAAWEGDDEMAVLLYVYKANPNIYDKLDRTPLHIATERGYTSLVKILVEQFRASLTARTSDGSTMMHIASLSGHPETAELFFKMGVPLLMPNKMGALSLHSAARRGHNSMVKILLDKGANVNAVTNDNYTALHIAVLFCKPDVVQTLLGYGAAVNMKGGPDMETPLHIAARISEGEKCADILIKSGADVNAKQLNGETSLHIASRFGNLRMVEILLQEKANPFAESNLAENSLQTAVRNCYLPIVIELIRFVEMTYGKVKATSLVNHANTEGETSIHLAAQLTSKNAHHRFEEVEIMRILLEYNGDLTYQTKKLQETPLHYCAKYGNDKTFALMLQMTPSAHLQNLVNKQDANGWTPLLVASEIGSSAIVRLLLQNQARVDIFDEQGKAALHEACESGHEDIVEELMANKAYVNIKSKLGITPLHLAALNGYNHLVLTLITKYQATIDAYSLAKRTPLHFASQSGQTQVCDTLVSRGADLYAFDTSGQSPIHLAAENNHPKVVKLFLKNKPDLASLATQAGNTCAHIAAAKGSIEVIKELMKFDLKVVTSYRNKEDDATPLHLAAKGGHGAIVELLIEAGASPKEEDREGFTALHLAARFGHTQVYKTITANSPLLLTIVSSKTGLNPLHVAAKYGNVDFVRDMLERVPATIKSELTPEIARNNKSSTIGKTDFGLTPLHFAAEYGHENVVRLLLNSKGVKVDTPTILYGYIPLHLAAIGGHTSVASILLSKSSDQLNIRDKKGRSALHVAASKGQYDMVSLLISQGAEVDAIDKNNWTPLHYAANSGYLTVVRRLILSNASPLVASDQGKIPLNLALANNHFEVFNFLVGKEHPVYPLILEDREFVFDMMLCGRLNDNKNIEEYILASPVPIEVAVLLSRKFTEAANREKERSKELMQAAKYCEDMAYELMSIAVTEGQTPAIGANSILRASDHTGMKQFMDVLIQNNLKTVVSHPSVQIWLSQVWVGSLRHWQTYRFIGLFIIMLLFPPLWVALSLPSCHKYNHNPIIKFICYLGSHALFIILLIISTALPIYPVYESVSLVPHWNEWILLAWIIGNFLQELSARAKPRGLGWIKVLILMVCAAAIMIHILAAFFRGRNRLIVLYTRNQLFAIALVMALVQFLEFLSFDNLFGPWAIIIRELIKDMGRFVIVLFLFLAGFSFSFTTIYLPMMPLTNRKNAIGEEIYGNVFLNPIESFEMLFFALFGLVSPDMLPTLNQVPEYSIYWVKIVFGVYLMVTFIVLINLLIAMMSDTYQRIQSDSDLEWKFGRAQLIINMERQPPAPSPINIFTKLWTYFNLFQIYGTKIFSMRKEEILNEEERMENKSASTRSLQALADSSAQLMSGFVSQKSKVAPDPLAYLRRDPNLTRSLKDVVNWSVVGNKYLKMQGIDVDRNQDKVQYEEPVAKKRKNYRIVETLDLLKSLNDIEKPENSSRSVRKLL